MGNQRKGLISRSFSAALRPFRDIADELEGLPDGQKVKPWTEILISFVSTPLAIVGAFVTLAGVSIAAADLYVKYSVRQAEELRIRNSPVHVALDVKVSRAPSSDIAINSTPYVALLIDVSAKNLSQRDFYILSNKWVAYGIALKPRFGFDPRDASAFEHSFNPSDQKQFKHLDEVKSPVASGSIFADNVLRPAEIISRRILVYAPNNEYRYLRLEFSLPIISKAARDDYFEKQRKDLFLAYSGMGVGEWNLYECPEKSVIEGGEVVGSLDANPKCSSLLASRSPEYIKKLEFLQKLVVTEVAI